MENMSALRKLIKLDEIEKETWRLLHSSTAEASSLSNTFSVVSSAIDVTGGRHGNILCPSQKSESNSTQPHAIHQKQAISPLLGTVMSSNSNAPSMTAHIMNSSNTALGASNMIHVLSKQLHAKQLARNLSCQHQLSPLLNSRNLMFEPKSILHGTTPATRHPSPVNSTIISLSEIEKNRNIGTRIRAPSLSPTRRNVKKGPKLSTASMDKVQAALKSQHQRGKKRNDLSDNEREELTRTRNRQHAKSTRIRKKTRYNELLQCEVKLNQFLKSRELHDQRIKCLQAFLSVRQDMLNGNITEDSLVLTSSLKNTVVDPLVNFQFHVRKSAVPINVHDDVSAAGSLAVAHMKYWDEKLRMRVASTMFGPKTPVVVDEYKSSPQSLPLPSSPADSTFLYEIENGTDSIAISKNGIGYAHVRLIFEKATVSRSSPPKIYTMERINIMTAVLKVQFNTAEPFDRISSFEWTTIEDHLKNQKLSPTSTLSSFAAIVAATVTDGNKDSTHPSCLPAL